MHHRPVPSKTYVETVIDLAALHRVDSLQKGLIQRDHENFFLDARNIANS